MGRFTKRPKAEADLLAIWLYIAQDSPRAADRLLDRIEAQCRLLADNPRLGRARPEIAPDARAWIVARYLVLYREQDDGIEVVRVVHGARRVEQIEF
ncbi:MAG: type II toxin-antitoxin system RelE/ParE family toxin [Geminicoccaceae bacterium]